jgi:hypothetical protein
MTCTNATRQDDAGLPSMFLDALIIRRSQVRGLPAPRKRMCETEPWRSP